MTEISRLSEAALPSAPAPVAHSTSEVDREMLFREAEWVERDVEHFRTLADRYYAVYIAGSYAMAAWLVSRALDRPDSVALDDAFLWSLRTRADLSIGIAAITVLGCVSTLMQINAVVRGLASNLHLVAISEELQSKATTWGWRFPHHALPSVRRWNLISTSVVLSITAVLTMFGLWFVRPVVYVSWFGRASWWTALVVLAAHAILWFVFQRTLPGLLKKDRETMSKERTPQRTAQSNQRLGHVSE